MIITGFLARSVQALAAMIGVIGMFAVYRLQVQDERVGKAFYGLKAYLLQMKLNLKFDDEEYLLHAAETAKKDNVGKIERDKKLISADNGELKKLGVDPSQVAIRRADLENSIVEREKQIANMNKHIDGIQFGKNKKNIYLNKL